jgi:tetratricopeptide (TPR) repeat protein
VVTSRHTRASLVTHLFARTVRLAPLTAREARDLLELRLGPERTLGMEAAVAAVAERCAHLPLALVVAAGRAWSRPDIPLDVLAGQLTAGLGELDDGDPAVSVRTVLSWSYRQLSPAAARLFRLFAVHPGPDVSVQAAAGLAGMTRAAAGAALTELVAMNMVGESTPGRFSLHSILREFALERAAEDERDEELESARQRLFDSYLHSAISANNACTTQPTPDEPSPREPAPGSDVTEFDARDSGTATQWFAAEREVLANLISAGVERNRNLFVWQMVCAQASYLGLAVRYEENMEFVRLGLRSARALGDTVAEAHLHLLLGRDLARVGDTGGALAHLDQAKRAYEAAGHEVGMAATHRTTANVWYVAGDYEAACQGMTKFLEYSRATGQHRAEAMALNALGWFQANLGRYDNALKLLHEALDLLQTTGDYSYCYHIWDSVGFVHHRRRDYEQAVAAYTAAITTSLVRGAEHQAALGHLRVGDVYRDAGDLDAAKAHWTTALKLSVEQRWPEMEDARARLTGLEMGRSVA